MQLPGYLLKYREDAERILSDGLVREIEFSGGTYQVQVVDPSTHKEAWAFLQLDARGHIKDCFCSCEDEPEEEAGCLHLAAAFLRIYNHTPSPLHVRFENSLWNNLCRLYCERIGSDPDRLKILGRGQYSFNSAGGKRIFYIKGRTSRASAHLKEMIEKRHRETEETSLKFSNLSQEEIILWKEGRPTPQLTYELSYWNDLAKWMMRLQEDGAPYKVAFTYSSKNIPNGIQITFAELQAEFYLSEANLPLIIPSLASVNTSLTVHDTELEAIDRIVYDKKNKCLIVVPKKSYLEEISLKESLQGKEGFVLNGWTYVPGDGFYAKKGQGLLTAETLISGKDISKALNENLPLVQSFLEGIKIHPSPVEAAYSIDFDAPWNLHISCYLFAPGDLSEGDSAYFGEWVYLDDDGFYRLEGIRFPDAETIILQEDVADFVSQNRTWLNTQEGFHTHLTSIEAQMIYQLSEDNRLSFQRKVMLEETGKSKDFGNWLYIAGQGFYAKVTSAIGLPVRPGIALGSEQIPLFIRMNREELQLVPGFFSQKCPVVKSGLKIHLLDDERIQILPEYQLLPEYQQKAIRFFDDFVYTEGEGFHELPVDSRLPERFRRPLLIDQENLGLFLIYELDSIKQYAVSIDPKLIKPPRLQLIAQSIERELTLGKGWYAMKLHYQSERGQAPATQLWRAMKQKKRFYFDEMGLIDLDEKRFDWLRILAKNRLDLRSNVIWLSTVELIRLNAFEEIVVSNKSKEAQSSNDLLQELTEFRIPEPPDVKGLKCDLRPYQQKGLQWLWFLYSHQLSGLLCDDMGLGKTHQAMALFAGVINQFRHFGELRPRFLIICPTSVIFHWQEKLEGFLPGVKVCAYHGPNRSLNDFHQSDDVLLTTYGIWRIDCEKLSQIPFEVAVFDEVQIAKNHHSRVYSSLLNVDAQMRVGLTGTPIENRLRELKALFDIVLPSYMPGETDYREFFMKPIEKDQDVQRRGLLTKFIKPFVLRRKKNDVLPDLPEKTEEISHCVLLPEQETLYRNVLEQSRRKVLADLQNGEAPIPYVHIFAILSHLKQICDHPAVYLKDVEKYKSYPSGKWDLFVELLNEARESQQKVVVYSQYLGMLDIIEAHLNDLGIGYASIRGSTINRGEQVQRFNRDPLCEVFVGSLQAAGLGVDLTAASVVIHYDRWWNAARENQATDRVHRIGQMRGVQVFKLVTKGTFEEKIDALIMRKAKLMDEVVDVDDQQLVKQFSRDEIIQLLQYVESSR